MTKKDFECLAFQMLRFSKLKCDFGDYDTYFNEVENLASSLEANYPNFNKDLFLTACGVTDD